jgi:hypothetical protein
MDIPLTWTVTDAADRRLSFRDSLRIEQQRTQPDWQALLMNPPYTLLPVRQRESLIGRDAMLTRLFLHATSGTSTFLWGQKRVGKTSVLHVLAGELQATGKVACVFLRMGEIVGFHEGQIAHVIATRLSSRCTEAPVVPSEESFGATLSRLIPYIEQLAANTSNKLVVIVDEFDDLDPAFYTGERGRQFVKALRSLSEVGLTFFFVGSERMDAIYARHAIELNKWVNVALDRLEAFADCRELILKPVQGSLDFDDAAVVFIVAYCGGNPFYMQLFCFEVFKRCVEDHRTFISTADIQIVRQHLLRSLGKTNFAHFWEDNPELASAEFQQQAAENSLVLTCAASLGGRYEDVEDLYDAQESLALDPAEYISRGALTGTVERLRRRRVLVFDPADNRMEIALPIFREWLAENSDDVISTWREFARRPTLLQGAVAAAPTTPDSSYSHFPIPEDDLLAVSQRLVYCGKQKDVAEVRQWLRQFDDDNRIEVAFILLRRLAEHGYINEGVRGRMMAMVEDALQHRRLVVGDKTWKIVRGRKDNLCITFVDSETKSGAFTARELGKRLRPGKVADSQSVQSWLRSHASEDPILLIADDFAGTGQSLETGLTRFVSSTDSSLLDTYLAEGRVCCYLQFSFPEALDRLRTRFPRFEFFAAQVFGDDVRALDQQAGLFESDAERAYAQEVLMQLGRELTPQNPLGWGDLGALVAFHNAIPNNSLPIFWSYGKVNDIQWQPLFPRA